MKGPGGRIRHRIVRRWVCPRCGKTAEAGGQVTFLACSDCSKGPDDLVGMAVLDPTPVRPIRPASPRDDGDTSAIRS